MNYMLRLFTKTLAFLRNGELLGVKIEKENIMSMVYTLELLSCKGLTVRGTVHKSLIWLKEWYEQQGDYNYLELALLQMCALCQMGLAQENDAALYAELCELAGTSMEDLMVNCTDISRHIKISRQGINNLIGKWMPSRKNPMTKADVVDDIMDKLIHHKNGQYYYYYEKSWIGNNRPDTVRRDLYKLVINQEESFFLDLKQFRIYTFEFQNTSIKR